MHNFSVLLSICMRKKIPEMIDFIEKFMDEFSESNCVYNVRNQTSLTSYDVKQLTVLCDELAICRSTTPTKKKSKQGGGGWAELGIRKGKCG